MSTILNIETATKVCSVALAKDGELLSSKESNEKEYSHSENLSSYIDEVIRAAQLDYNQLDAVSISSGPGSYTGLRIGTSTAKGLCFAMDIPLISVSTLQAMALQVINQHKHEESALFCPMIDARRMEVYAALFDSQNQEVRKIKAEIIDETSYLEYLSKNQVYFFGDGSSKCKEIISGSDNSIFIDDIFPSAKTMISIAEYKYANGLFEDTAYFEPYYLKDFVAGKPKKLV